MEALRTPILHREPDGRTRFVRWPNPWEPFRISTELRLPAIEGLTRHGWLWTYSADDGSPPQHWVTIRQDHAICGWHLVRADGIYFWSFLRWWIVEQAQNLNFAALRAMALFCWKRKIGDFKSIEGFCLSWRIILAALIKAVPSEWAAQEQTRASREAFERRICEGRNAMGEDILAHFNAKAGP